jgi:hypothetical protein
MAQPSCALTGPWDSRRYSKTASMLNETVDETTSTFLKTRYLAPLPFTQNLHSLHLAPATMPIFGQTILD